MGIRRGYRRNDSSPTKGIDTNSSLWSNIETFAAVEMIVARLRALTQRHFMVAVVEID